MMDEMRADFHLVKRVAKTDMEFDPSLPVTAELRAFEAAYRR